MTSVAADLDLIKGLIRDVPDFPKRGILFKDITPLLADAKGFKALIDALEAQCKDLEFASIAGIESRGFIVGAALAERMGKGLVLLRKKGKLPAKTIEVTYDLEYGQDTLQVHADAVAKGEKVLIMDDLLATGGTAAAAVELIEKAGGTVAGIGMIIELAFLNGRDKFKDYRLDALLKF